MSRHIENQLGKRIKKHVFDRILEQNKQTNQLFLNVQKSTDNCYLIPVDNKNSIIIPEQRKNRLKGKYGLEKVSLNRKFFTGIVILDHSFGLNVFK